MRPAGVESNHYAYHLEKLISEGLVEKHDRQYSLTTRGLALADRLNHSTVDIKLQPHIVVAAHITNGAGQDLLYQHSFQPYLGLHGAPQGRLEYEDKSTLDAAKRETKEKTGLVIESLEHRGIVYVTANIKDVRISKILLHIFSGQVDGTPTLSEPTAKGEALWGDANQLAANQCMPGYLQIRQLLQTNSKLFFDEITAELYE